MFALAVAASLGACEELYGSPSPAPSENPLEALLRQQQQQLPPADAAAQAAFLERNAKAAGVPTTRSGLQYKVLASGPATGARPALGDAVKVNYKGSFIDGTPFDASDPGTPSVFQVGGVVEGMNEALTMMRPGDKWMLYLPPALGYGDQPPPGAPIPPGSVLVFELELLEVTPASTPTEVG